MYTFSIFYLQKSNAMRGMMGRMKSVIRLLILIHVNNLLYTFKCAWREADEEEHEDEANF